MSTKFSNVTSSTPNAVLRKKLIQYLMEEGSYFVSGAGNDVYVCLLHRSVSQQEIEGCLTPSVRERVSITLCAASLTRYDNQRGDNDVPLHYVKIHINS